MLTSVKEVTPQTDNQQLLSEDYSEINASPGGKPRSNNGLLTYSRKTGQREAQMTHMPTTMDSSKMSSGSATVGNDSVQGQRPATLKYFSSGPYKGNSRHVNYQKSKSIDNAGTHIKVQQPSQTMNPKQNEVSFGGWEDTTADESSKQKGAVMQSHSKEPQLRTKKIRRRNKKKTRMSIEIQRLKTQLYDDKNFIFNSQNQFGFSSTTGYNFIDKRYNKH